MYKKCVTRHIKKYYVCLRTSVFLHIIIIIIISLLYVTIIRVIALAHAHTYNNVINIVTAVQLRVILRLSLSYLLLILYETVRGRWRAHYFPRSLPEKKSTVFGFQNVSITKWFSRASRRRAGRHNNNILLLYFKIVLL